MKLHGVINASPDSLADFSIATTVDDALARAHHLIGHGCAGIDLGGAGSTQFADRVETEEEWERLADIVPAIANLGVELSVDTWNPEVMRRSLAAGANLMNAADGLQNPDMVAIAADAGCLVVLPFLSGIDPKAMEFVGENPLDVILPWFEKSLARLATEGISEDQIIVDPGTGFGPADWAWEDRYQYQKDVYGNLDRLRVFGMPIYMALPWKDTEQHRELLEILLTVGFDYGRCHHPDVIIAAADRLGVPAPRRSFVAVGSNLGDRRSYLQQAVTALSPTRVSDVYETEPVGGPPEQDAYLNMVLELHTEDTPQQLLARCQEVEAAANRTTDGDWQPRTLDIDLLTYGDTRLESDDLVLPHPQMWARRFVVQPLAELAPHLIADDWEYRVDPGVVHRLGPLNDR